PVEERREVFFLNRCFPTVARAGCGEEDEEQGACQTAVHDVALIEKPYERRSGLWCAPCQGGRRGATGVRAAEHDVVQGRAHPPPLRGTSLGREDSINKGDVVKKS